MPADLTTEALILPQKNFRTKLEMEQTMLIFILFFYSFVFLIPSVLYMVTVAGVIASNDYFWRVYWFRRTVDYLTEEALNLLSGLVSHALRPQSDNSNEAGTDSGQWNFHIHICLLFPVFCRIWMKTFLNVFFFFFFFGLPSTEV